MRDMFWNKSVASVGKVQIGAGPGGLGQSSVRVPDNSCPCNHNLLISPLDTPSHVKFGNGSRHGLQSLVAMEEGIQRRVRHVRPMGEQ